MVESTACPNCGQEYDTAESACPACGRLATATPCARHPDRTAEGQCVICAQPVCEECTGGNRTHFSCPEHHEIPVIEGWAQIYSTGDDVEAGLIRENLRSEGIDAEVLSQKDRSFAVEMGELSPVRILVPAFAYRKARAILDAHSDPMGEVRFACPACGEALEPQTSVCPACGNVLE